MSASQDNANPVTVADYLRVSVIAAWGLALLWLLTTGSFTKFIAPSLWWLLLLGVGCLLVFLIGIIISGGGESHHHGQADNAWVRAAVVLLPLAFVMMAIPQGSLGGYALEKRATDLLDGPVEITPSEPPGIAEKSSDSVSGSPTASDQSQAAPKAANSSGMAANGKTSGDLKLRKLTLSNLLYDLEADPEIRVTTEGMLFHSKRLGDGQCMLFRFVMTCCAADAMPVSVILVHPDVDTFPGDAWVRVTGIAHMQAIRGVNRAVLKAEQVEQIPEPRRPYLSPY